MGRAADENKISFGGAGIFWNYIVETVAQSCAYPQTRWGWKVDFIFSFFEIFFRYFLKFIYFGERERERMCRGGAEREADRISVLTAQSLM